MRLVYVSPVPLASFAQRPHHFVRWLHERHDAQVLWIDPYPARLPGFPDARRLRRRRDAHLGPRWASEDWIQRLRVPSIPFEPLALGRRVNQWLWRERLRHVDRFLGEDHVAGNTWLVAGKPCALALTLAQRFSRTPLVFDVMDNVPAFTSGVSRRWLSDAEAELARRSDWIITASTPLERKFSAHQARLRRVHNGLTTPDLPYREDIRRTRQNRLVFGYVGTISSWFDWHAVDALAARFPDSVVRLIGPCDTRPRALRPNIELLPATPQHLVYEAMRDFTVGIVPFTVDELTDFVDPVKYYEYRALGLPVLSTRFGEMRERGAADHVLFFDELGAATDIPGLCREAGRAGEVTAFRDANCWNRRFDALDLFAKS